MQVEWTNIAIDLGILSLIGLVYYFYQKRKIIRISKEEILDALVLFRYKINEYAELQRDSSEHSSIIKLSDEFEKCFEQDNLEGYLALEQKLWSLSPELQEEFKMILSRIHDHNSSK